MFVIRVIKSSLDIFDDLVDVFVVCLGVCV